MLEHLLDEEISHVESGTPPCTGYDLLMIYASIDTFAHDFLLTSPAFMSSAAICDGLLAHYRNTSTEASQLSPEQQMERKEK